MVIGREGQNVRLASKLTGYNIEVEGNEEKEVIDSEVQDREEAEEASLNEEKSDEKQE